MPAPRHSSLSLSLALAVMATIGTLAPALRSACSHVFRLVHRSAAVDSASSKQAQKAHHQAALGLVYTRI